MRIARLTHDGEARWAVLDPAGDVYRLCASSEPWNDPSTDLKAHLFQAGSLLPPSLPGKIVAVGLNYRGHIQEMKHEEHADPVIFLKPPSALLNPGGKILYPPSSSRVDFEAELAVVLKRRLRNATPEESLGAIWGFTCCNDVTARDLQKRDGQWARAKGFDTFCPLGPWLVTDFKESGQRITCRVNGELKQDAKISTRIWDTARLLSFVSGVMTLDPLDVLTTGTPSGIGPLLPGDAVEVEVEGIGVLRNLVAI